MDSYKMESHLIPDEIKEKYGDDIVFDNIIDGEYSFGFPISNQEFLKQRIESKRKQIFYNKYFSECNKIIKRFEDGLIDQDECKRLMEAEKIKRDQSIKI